MNSEYVSINYTNNRSKWGVHFGGWLVLVFMSIVGIHAMLSHVPNGEMQVGAGTFNPNEVDLKEDAVGVKLTPVTSLSSKQPRLFVVHLECQPEQVEFVQHLITNVALLANENRDIPDATGQAETFIIYEAFASTRPVTSCDQLFLIEAYPNEASQRIHSRAAYKNGLEIMKVLRGTKRENGLPGFDFARKGLMTTFACKTDCRAEIRQEKINLIRAERQDVPKEVKPKKGKAETDVRVYTGGIHGHGVKRYTKAEQIDPAKMMQDGARKEYLKKVKKPVKVVKKQKVVESEHEDAHPDYYESEADLRPLTHHIRSSTSQKTRDRYIQRVFRRPREAVEVEPDSDEEGEDLFPQQEVSPVTQYVSSRDQKPVIIHEKTERTHIIPMRVEELPQQHITEPQEDEVYYPPNEQVEEPPHRIILVPSHPKPQPQQVVHVVHHQMYQDPDDESHESPEHHIVYSLPGNENSHAGTFVYSLPENENSHQLPEQTRIITQPVYGEAQVGK